DVSHGCRPLTVPECATGEFDLFGQFAGDADHPRGCGRLEWIVPRSGRPRVELLLSGRAADYGSAEQGLLESDSVGVDSIAGSDLRRATRGIWRQNELGHQSDDALRFGGRSAARERKHILR